MDELGADPTHMQAQVDLVCARRGLGRSPVLERLLRYLLACALDGHSPKEAEIAAAVWGRSPAADDGDASVRVYIHRLRHKLERFYAGPGADQARRLILPKGSYGLDVAAVAAEPGLAGLPVDAPVSAQPVHARPNVWYHVVMVALIVGAALAGWAAGAWRGDHGPLVTVQASPLWRPLLDGNHRITLVLGDYYIFGERDDQGNIGRLIREFDINSARDLDDLKSMNPARAGRYADLDLAYLPVGVGEALRSVAPVLCGTTGVQVVTASRLGVSEMQANSLVYLGYLSGLGLLHAPMLDGARFVVGDSYDEIVDRATGHHYLASSHLEASDSLGEDYALISAFRGASGNRIIIIAGTRDAALAQAAEFVTRPATLAQLRRGAGDGQSFEALLSIPAMRDVGLDARLIAVAARADPSWTNGRLAPMPDAVRTPHSGGTNP